jgi:hypothetical protein
MPPIYQDVNDDLILIETKAERLRDFWSKANWPKDILEDTV